MQQQDQIKLFYNLYNHNQETVYFGSYDMSFNPYITDEGKLKYENKVDGIFQTRHVKSPLKIEFLADHLVVNKYILNYSILQLLFILIWGLLMSVNNNSILDSKNKLKNVIPGELCPDILSYPPETRVYFTQISESDLVEFHNYSMDERLY